MSFVILGGGLSGLSAAYYLLKQSPRASVIILESSNRCGGWIRSQKLPNGIIFEQGPRTIRPAGIPGANTLKLIEELELSNRITPILRTHPAATNRLIYANGELHLLPSKLTSLFTKQAPFSKPLIMQLMKDVVTPKKHIVEQDEAIYNFVERRFGREAADYLISPMICGICAGNAKEVSVNFLLKSLFEFEQKYGSISRGLIASVVTSRKTKQQDISSELAQKARDERWSVYSFEDGVEELPDTLKEVVTAKGCKIQYCAECIEITPSDKKMHIKLKTGRNIEADHVISSLPANSLGKLVQKSQPDLSKLLETIGSVTVAVVNLAFKRRITEKQAFGFLVAPKENLPILGVIYDSCCFPRGDRTVFTVMLGGYWFKEYFGENPTEGELLKVALEQLRTILKFNDDPDHCKVNILHSCIPQYTVGHNSRVDSIFKCITDNKLPLSLCGSSYSGVGVNDVILSAKNAVEHLKS